MSFTKVFYNNDSFQDGALQMYRAFAMNTNQLLEVYSYCLIV